MKENSLEMLRQNIQLSLDALDGLFKVPAEKYISQFVTHFFVFNDKATYRRQILNTRIKSKNFIEKPFHEKKFPIDKEDRKFNPLMLYCFDPSINSFMEGCYINIHLNTTNPQSISRKNYEDVLKEELKNVINRLLILNEETGLKSQVVNYQIDINRYLGNLSYISFDLIFEDEYQFIPHQIIKKERG
jgi:hypothetical protein